MNFRNSTGISFSGKEFIGRIGEMGVFHRIQGILEEPNRGSKREPIACNPASGTWDLSAEDFSLSVVVVSLCVSFLFFSSLFFLHC